MEETTKCFDAKTAKRIKKNVVGSPHSAFSDASGNICLLGRGRLSGGGVAFNKGALAWLGDLGVTAENVIATLKPLIPDAHMHYNRDTPRGVTSRRVVGLLSEQLWLQFVPVFHRLQGRVAAQG
jgi:hypothetical protein